MFFFLACLFAIIEHRNFNLKENTRKLKYFGLIFVLFNVISLATHAELIFETSDGIINIFILLLFYMLCKKERDNTLKIFLICLTVLFAFSLVEYVLYLLGRSYLLASYIERGEGSSQVYAHGIFNVFFQNALLVRFQGLFREPGHLGLLAGVLMFSLDKYNNKLWMAWLIYGLASLSLVFYLLLGIQFFLRIIEFKSYKRLWGVFCVVITLLVAYNSSTFVQGIAEDAIFIRVEGYYDKGGDSRSTEDLDERLDRANSFETLFGYGVKSFNDKDLAWGNTGMKADAYKYGYVGIILLFLMAFVLIRYPRMIKYNILATFLLMLCYYYGDVKFSFHFHLPLYSLYYAYCIQKKIQ